MHRSSRLCELLCHEFVLAAPCTKLPDKLVDAVEKLILTELFSEVTCLFSWCRIMAMISKEADTFLRKNFIKID